MAREVLNAGARGIAGALAVLGGCGELMAYDAALAPPRALAPLSTSTVTSHRPTLRWQLAPGTDGARVEVCADRACTTITQWFDVTGAAGRPPSPLAPGACFWRLRGRAAGRVGPPNPVVWTFHVGVRDAPVDTAWGSALDVDGDGVDDLAVGAPGAARVYVYAGRPGGPPGVTPSIALADPDGTVSNFGISVASAGDVNGDGFGDLLVGADLASRAYVYYGPAPAGGWTAPDAVLGVAAPAGWLGYPVVGAGDLDGDGFADVAVGAYYGTGACGCVHVYRGGAGGLDVAHPIVITLPDGVVRGFGTVASAGDLNGDAYADLAIGARNGGAGAALVYLGGPGWATVAPGPTTLSGRTPGEQFGNAVASAGDVNGDGYADLLVGAYQADAATGRVDVFLGSAAGLSDGARTSLVSPDAPGGQFGASVTSAGDVDGDGRSDVAIGGSPVTLPATGAAHVYLGSTTGVTPTPATTWSVAVVGGYYGVPVAAAGDVYGTGRGGLLVGADAPTAGQSVVTLYTSRRGVLDAASATFTRIDDGTAWFGFALAGAGP